MLWTWSCHSYTKKSPEVKYPQRKLNNSHKRKQCSCSHLLLNSGISWQKIKTGSAESRILILVKFKSFFQRHISKTKSKLNSPVQGSDFHATIHWKNEQIFTHFWRERIVLLNKVTRMKTSFQISLDLHKLDQGVGKILYRHTVEILYKELNAEKPPKS